MAVKLCLEAVLNTVKFWTWGTNRQETLKIHSGEQGKVNFLLAVDRGSGLEMPPSTAEGVVSTALFASPGLT